jgi:hypothetical protein
MALNLSDKNQRNEYSDLFKDIVTHNLKRINKKIEKRTENYFKVSDWYDKYYKVYGLLNTLEDNYDISSNIFYENEWIPEKKEFILKSVDVIPENNGLGSLLTKISEDCAKELGCKKIIISNIIKTSLEYWKRNKEYSFFDNKAIKEIN